LLGTRGFPEGDDSRRFAPPCERADEEPVFDEPRRFEPLFLVAVVFIYLDFRLIGKEASGDGQWNPMLPLDRPILFWIELDLDCQSKASCSAPGAPSFSTYTPLA
jgi:hypothetical protein